MKETKAAASSAETRAAMHEVMAAFEDFRASNDDRLSAIERKGADPLLEEKVDRIETALSAAERRMERAFHRLPPPVFGRRRLGASAGGRTQGGLRRLPAHRRRGWAGAEGPV